MQHNTVLSVFVQSQIVFKSCAYKFWNIEYLLHNYENVTEHVSCQDTNKKQYKGAVSGLYKEEKWDDKE